MTLGAGRSGGPGISPDDGRVPSRLLNMRAQAPRDARVVSNRASEIGSEVIGLQYIQLTHWTATLFQQPRIDADFVEIVPKLQETISNRR